MSHQARLVQAGEFAEDALVGSPVFVDDGGLHALQMGEKDGRRLMLLVGYVDLQLMGTVGIEIASVAPKLYWIDTGQETKLPFIGRTSLLDVIDMAKTL